jgi:hypothetical protein
MCRAAGAAGGSAEIRAMRNASMQVLTWGTICGAVGSALWLAAAERAPHSMLIDVSRAAAHLPLEPTAAGLQDRRDRALPADEAGSSPPVAPTEDPR